MGHHGQVGQGKAMESWQIPQVYAFADKKRKTVT
jgi:hypothetical protein